jgi:hypothetical protein
MDSYLAASGFPAFRTLRRLRSHISRTPLLEAPSAHHILAHLQSSRITQNLWESGPTREE